MEGGNSSTPATTAQPLTAQGAEATSDAAQQAVPSSGTVVAAEVEAASQDEQIGEVGEGGEGASVEDVMQQQQQDSHETGKMDAVEGGGAASPAAEDDESDSDEDDSDESDSDESDSDESDSDSDSGQVVMDLQAAAKELLAMMEGDDAVHKQPPKTKGEEEAEALPEYENEAALAEDEELEEVATLVNVLPTQVVAEHCSTTVQPLQLLTPLYLAKARTYIGLIEDVFGPVSSPFYLIRTAKGEGTDAALQDGGEAIAYSPQRTSFVDAEAIRDKGTDASGQHDEPVPSNMVEYSDDEEERRAKYSAKKKKKKVASGTAGGQRSGQGQRRDGKRVQREHNAQGQFQQGGAPGQQQPPQAMNPDILPYGHAQGGSGQLPHPFAGRGRGGMGSNAGMAHAQGMPHPQQPGPPGAAYGNMPWMAMYGRGYPPGYGASMQGAFPVPPPNHPHQQPGHPHPPPHPFPPHHQRPPPQ